MRNIFITILFLSISINNAHAINLFEKIGEGLDSVVNGVGDLFTFDDINNQTPTDKEQNKQGTNVYKLTVTSEPNSSIKIMNIVPKYHDKKILPPGKYDVKVQKEGDKSSRKIIRIHNSDVNQHIKLEKVSTGISTKVASTRTDNKVNNLSQATFSKNTPPASLDKNELPESDGGYVKLTSSALIEMESKKAPKLETNSRFDGIRPKQLYTPELISLGKPSANTQTELDEDLIKQVKSDKYSKYKDFNNYKNVAKIISEGAYISEEALLSAISGHYKNDTGKDFKSFQLLYLNGAFEPEVFNILNCRDLKIAITPNIRTSGTNEENAHTNAEQIALFLSDKVRFNKCKRLLSEVTLNDRFGEINLNVAKILLDQKVNTDGVLEKAIDRAWGDEVFVTYSEKNIAKGRKITLDRFTVIKFLINEGVKPNAKHLEQLFAKYIKLISPIHPRKIPTQKTVQAQFSRVAKLLMNSGVFPNEHTEALFIKYRKKIAKIQERINGSSYDKKSKKKAQYTVSLYPETIKVFEVDGKVDVHIAVKEHSLSKQLHEAVVAKDKRRTKFYIKKGAKGKLATLRQAIANNMNNAAIAIMDQKLDYDPNMIANLAIKNKSPKLVTYLLENKKLEHDNSETLIVAAAENRMSSTIKELIVNGADPVKAIQLSIKKHGADYPSQIISKEGNQKSRSIFEEFQAEEARKSEIARQEAQAKRIAREEEDQRLKEIERQQYFAKKIKGDMVCKDGRMAIFLNITIKAFVEDSAGNNIRIRIADTEGTSPNYNGVTLNKNTVIWDDYKEWRKCN